MGEEATQGRQHLIDIKNQNGCLLLLVPPINSNQKLIKRQRRGRDLPDILIRRLLVAGKRENRVFAPEKKTQQGKQSPPSPTTFASAAVGHSSPPKLNPLLQQPTALAGRQYFETGGGGGFGFGWRWFCP